MVWKICKSRMGTNSFTAFLQEAKITLSRGITMTQCQNISREGTVQPKVYDHLFIAIFGKDNERSKRWRLELYNALNDTNYTDPDALELNTLENVIFIKMHNDVSFLVDSQMTLYEHQRTTNPNMPLRGLFYFA